MIRINGQSCFHRSQNLEYPTETWPMLAQISAYRFQRPCLVRFEGNSLTSIRLKPVTRPGRRSACSSAVFLIVFQLFRQNRHYLAAVLCFHGHVKLNHFSCSVLPGCKTGCCVCSAKRRMFSYKFFSRGKSIPFLHADGLFPLCQRR